MGHIHCQAFVITTYIKETFDTDKSLCYYPQMKLKDLNDFNEKNLNNHQLSLAGGMSYPTVGKYLNGKVHEPSILQIIKLLKAMGVDRHDVTLGEILADTAAS